MSAYTHRRTWTVDHLAALYKKMVIGKTNDENRPVVHDPIRMRVMEMNPGEQNGQTTANSLLEKMVEYFNAEYAGIPRFRGLGTAIIGNHAVACGVMLADGDELDPNVDPTVVRNFIKVGFRGRAWTGRFISASGNADAVESTTHHKNSQKLSELAKRLTKVSKTALLKKREIEGYNDLVEVFSWGRQRELPEWATSYTTVWVDPTHPTDPTPHVRIMVHKAVHDVLSQKPDEMAKFMKLVHKLGAGYYRL